MVCSGGGQEVGKVGESRKVGGRPRGSKKWGEVVEVGKKGSGPVELLPLLMMLLFLLESICGERNGRERR